jgi:hypothetical protein
MNTYLLKDRKPDRLIRPPTRQMRETLMQPSRGEA